MATKKLPAEFAGVRDRRIDTGDPFVGALIGFIELTVRGGLPANMQFCVRTVNPARPKILWHFQNYAAPAHW